MEYYLLNDNNNDDDDHNNNNDDDDDNDDNNNDNHNNDDDNHNNNDNNNNNDNYDDASGCFFTNVTFTAVAEISIRGDFFSKAIINSLSLTCFSFISLSGVPDYFGRNKISSGGDLSHYSSASLY